ncbi:Hpt domain-containing protein [Adlercreutzia sp. ZJ304]|uniref:Hpt domain-containing protein n=1 Tax=Adlercreutzia sp. ZJ304 TaxID=2709791 RepID=UPI0013ECF9A5|nr:Hpt domain-containing protein [Adlercreutzia sp. ZJ304]
MLNNKLLAYGIDYNDAMDRMGNNADLYKKLAMKYLDNECMADLLAAMEIQDFDAAYTAAHTLKGASGNLSFNELYEISASESEALREGEYQAAEEMLSDVKAAHDKVIAGLTKWADDEL